MALRALLVGLALIGAACGGSSAASAERADTLPPVGALPSGPSALDTPLATVFPSPLISPSQMLSGGPPPDGIPSIDTPSFVDVADNNDLLSPSAPVVAVEIAGQARAYPVEIMIWHEIVNDTIAGVPVVVTYCPLCNSAIAYIRRVRGVETTFGTSGLLYASSLVMYDRATETLWTHFDGRAVVGLLTGDELEVVPAPLMAWSAFVERYPDGRVLDETKTGFSRDYGRNPYVGYDSDQDAFTPVPGLLDTREAAKERVVGVDIEAQQRAYRLSSLSSADGVAVISDTLAGVDIVVLWQEGQASALDTESVAGGRDIGTVGVFLTDVDRRRLTFSVAERRIVDVETGSTWSAAGIATAGELAGTELTRVNHFDTYWFAWSTFKPATTVYEPAS